MRYVLVTGASTGIGYSAVEHLLDAGYKVFGSVRKQDDADNLQSTFGENFIPLIFDVRDLKLENHNCTAFSVIFKFSLLGICTEI